MRDNSLYLMLLVFLETIMEIRKEGFFWEIFLVFGEKEARIKSCRSFEVFLFGFLIFFFFFLIYDDRFCISGQTNNGI